jgi:coproporphyrinogen III oxidase-like Fe-S oxidoreductase
MIHVWPDNTFCEPEDLEEYLKFMSDDYITVECNPEDIDYDQLVRCSSCLQ